ncbi:hypothetical protein P3875_09690 [Myroides sp. JBRI-B21084]|uniref:hypothetical protein n=1 Tax=Myroides sp. JBRI-B21084 TaxID=3119977 RepID=UPI0026E16ECC|nr:hypothetical protein [Paenimyroides cloacae]WKW46048.1 hypothetical protein P3875_09690 [Paenimyroides cloacae]
MKKVFALLLICLPLVILTVSCHEEEDPITSTSPYNNYKGSWTGTYIGSDTGEISFTVNGEGVIIGDVESAGFPNLDLTVSGKVNVHGEVTMNFIYTNDENNDEIIGSFEGTMNKSFSSGKWTNTKQNPAISGTWTATK